MEKKQNRTQLIHAGRQKAYTLGGVNPVVQRASSIIFDSLAEKKTRDCQSSPANAVLWSTRNDDSLFVARRNDRIRAGNRLCVISVWRGGYR